ncbi:SH3 domain-containing protein [Desulfosediminicola sp.]|uniref:SH3 domain-containing protein n=1 Tax=Desulfosediminicola sp. TaxID=2886825 RepID=UPI003AF25AC0
MRSTFDIGERLKVRVDLLNVRSGPGLNHDVVQQLTQGTGVQVEGVSSAWCLVRLADKSTGWIKSNYTTGFQDGFEG